jgi:ubiquinone/menaquinone biosynthesis C-methylase UbiE
MNASADQRYWDEQARTDPMWAILTDPEKRGRRWDPEEFFSSGVREIEIVMERAERLGLPLSRRRALDFGCGVGRLTQPLADHFEEVRGVDISPIMLEQARQFNRKGDRCQYVWNSAPDLRIFPDQSFDFIYSRITLQHVPPPRVESYLKEFLRVLAPGGLLLFQLPSRPVRPYRRIVALIVNRLVRTLNLMQVPFAMYMNGINRDRVVELLESHGGEVIDVEPNADAGPQYESFLYAVARKA